MKFSCEKALLQSAVITASRAVSSKSSIPALEGLLIEADSSGKLFITGYNQETGIRASLDADVVNPGFIVVPSRIFSEIIRKFPDEVISFQEDAMKINITCGKSTFNIMGIDPMDYPELPTVDYQNSFSIDEKSLRSMISQTIFAVSTDDSRPVHTGSLLSVDDDGLTMVAVDGFRLALRREKVLEKNGNFSFIVPGFSLSEVEKICSDSDNPVQIHQGSRHILFHIGSTILISRRMEGDFVSWKQAIPKNNPIRIEVVTKELLSCIERVSLIVSEKLKSPIRCVVGNDEIEISTKTALGTANDICSVSGNGEGLEIGFNNRFMMDALKNIPAEKVYLEMSSPITPCVIVPTDGNESFIYMVLPVRLKAEYQ